MKRCPTCRRDYNDSALSFCLDDGTPLLDGPATSEPSTAILTSGDSIPEFPTAILPNAQSLPGQSTSVTSETTSSASRADNLVVGLKRRKVAIGAISFLLAAVGFGLAIYKFAWRYEPDTASAPFQSIKMEPLTTNGKATQAVISPDGKQVVYVVDDVGMRSLWLRQVATGTDLRLTEPNKEWFYWALTISPDGNFLYYVYGGTTVRNRILYKMPLVGGSPTKVIEDVGSPVGLSPDGKQIAFVRSRLGESSMMIANSDGTEEREIARRTGQETYGNIFAGGVAWTPDGKKILTVANARDLNGRFQNVIEILIADGTETSITSHLWYEIHRMAALRDGSGLVITASEKPAEIRARQIWFVPYPAGSGEVHKVTKDLNSYSNIGLSDDASVLVTVQEQDQTDIWVAPDGDVARAVELKTVSGKLDGWDGVRWTPDDRIVYTSMAGGNEDIWIMDGDGKNRKKLAGSEDMEFWPSVSTDGRFVVYTRERGRSRKTWRVDIDGSNAEELFQGNHAQTHGEWIVHGGAGQGGGGLWRTLINGGEQVRITEPGRGLGRCAISPDATMLACQFDRPGEESELGVIPIEGGPTKIYDVKFELPARIRWSADGSAVNYVSREDGIRDIWSQPLEGGPPKRLTNFKADQIFAFDWSRDNKLAISYGTSRSDILLIRNAK